MSTKRKTRVYGVTGMSGSGKSTFAEMLAKELGCPRIDIDEIGHDVTKDPEIIRVMREHYGDGILFPDGSVNRKAVGAHIFGSEERMNEYIGITWGWMQKKLDAILEKAGDAIVFEWMLLPKSGKYWEICTPKILVTADPMARKEAVLKRDGITEEYFDKRDSSALAFDTYSYDRIIVNDYTPACFERALSEIRKDYPALSSIPVDCSG